MSTPQIDAKLVLDSGGFVRGMNTAVYTVRKFTTAIGVAAGAVAAFMSLRGGIRLVNEQMQLIDSTAKLADRLGTTTEAMVGLQHAGNLAGVSAEQLATSATFLNKAIGQAAEGSKSSIESLGKLGLTYRDLMGIPLDRQMEKIADGFEKLKSASDRTVAATDLFGKSGAGMIAVLQDGAKGLRDARAEADDLGISFSRLDAAKVEQANDSITKLKSSFDGLFRTVGIALSPLIAGIADELTKSTKQTEQFSSTLDEAIKSGVHGAGVLYDAFNIVLTGWHAGSAAIKFLGMSVLSVVNDVLKAFQWWANVFSNFSKLIDDIGDLISAALKSPWESAKLFVLEFVKFSADQLISLTRKAADVAGLFSESLEASINEAADSMAAGVNSAYDKIKEGSSDAQKEISKLSAKVGNSLSNLFVTDELVDNETLKALYDNLKKSGEDSAVAFSQSFNDMMNASGSRSIDAFFSRVTAAAEKNAQELAAKKQQQIEENLALNKAAAEQAIIDEEARNLALYDTTMSWAQKTWTDLVTGWEESQEKIRQLREEEEANKATWWRAEGERQLKWDQMNAYQRVETAQEMLGNLSTLMNSHSKKMFKIGKMAAIANAVVSTAQGAAKALELGFPMGLIAAAAVIAAGAVQISSIQRTQFGGGGSVSSSGGPISLVNGEPAGVSATQGGLEGNQRNSLTINFNGLSDDMILNGRQVRTLIDQINEAQADGSTLTNLSVNAA